jgi:hypothetical protein
MSDNEMPEEIVRVSYVKLGDAHAIRFTINGVEQSLVLMPRIDPIVFVSSVFKTCMVLADPIGPCVNEEPY